MKQEHVLQRLRAFVAQELLEGDDDGLDESTPLVELGLVNSMSIVLLTSFIASEFGVDVPSQELGPDNLKDLGAIRDLVIRLTEKRSES